MAIENVVIEILIALGIVVASFVILRILFFVVRRYVSTLTAWTETTLDDEMLALLERYLPIGIILTGFYLGLITLSFLEPYAHILAEIYEILIILFVAVLAIRIINVFIQWYVGEYIPKTKNDLGEQFVPIVRIAVNFFILLVAFILILGLLNLEVSPFIATLGIGGIAVALALQEPLSNFFAGFYIHIDRPVRAGEFIRVETGDEGYIEEIGWRSTRLRSLSNNVIIIPNSRLGQSIITNYDRPTPDMGFGIPVGVSYDSDLEKVERVTIEVAREVIARTPGTVKEFEPSIRYNEFGTANIQFSVSMRVLQAVDRYLVTHEFIKALKKRYDAEGITISHLPRDLFQK
jgi:small-conductance mechanosensitive channel